VDEACRARPLLATVHISSYTPPSAPATGSSNGLHPILTSKSAIAVPASPLAPSAIRRVIEQSEGGAPRRRVRNLCENPRGTRCPVAGGGLIESESGSVQLGWSRQGSWCRGTRAPVSCGRGRFQPSGKVRGFAESTWQGPPKCHFPRLRSFPMNPSTIAISRHNPGSAPWKAQMQGHLPGLPISPALRSGRRPLQRPSPQKQFPSNQINQAL